MLHKDSFKSPLLDHKINGIGIISSNYKKIPTISFISKHGLAAVDLHVELAPTRASK
ncbi:hypothetical protein VINE108521_14380 [Vibrio neonatus]